jgi:hypothetical protein
MFKKILFTFILTAYSILSIRQQVFVNPNHTIAESGELFTTTIHISNATILGSFEVYLINDPQFINAQTFVIGDFWGSTGKTLFALLLEIGN